MTDNNNWAAKSVWNINTCKFSTKLEMLTALFTVYNQQESFIK